MQPSLSVSLSRRASAVPEIVRIILSCATRLHEQGRLNGRTYRAQLARLDREELHPRGLQLQSEPLPGGGWRFLIQAKRNDEVRAMVECPAERPEARSRAA